MIFRRTQSADLLRLARQHLEAKGPSQYDAHKALEHTLTSQTLAWHYQTDNKSTFFQKPLRLDRYSRWEDKSLPKSDAKPQGENEMIEFC
jgi:hypothetical protein